MSKIFISYRREDSSGFAGRIYDRLSNHFGEDRVFMDVATIEPGLNFDEVIENTVSSCSIVIVLIGKQWLTIADDEGRRLDNPNDFVRVEIAIALKRRIRIIPILLDGARMPGSNQLPDLLSSLSRRNALEIRHSHFNSDVERLIRTVKQVLKPKSIKQDSDGKKIIQQDVTGDQNIISGTGDITINFGKRKE